MKIIRNRFACFSRPTRFTLAALGSTLLSGSLVGCGGAGYGDFNRSLGGDINSGYNSSIAGRSTDRNNGPTSGLGRGTYPMLSTSFQLSNQPGDPFDYEKVNVQVVLKKPDNSTVELPAFYDGDNTWRMRFTPVAPGTYAVASVKLNGQIAHEEKLEKKDWNVSGDTQPGFVRQDRGDHARFVFDNGARYYPLGHNQAWHSDKLPDTPELFAKMHDAGENWSRVWMTHWDSKNLDWLADAPDVKAADTGGKSDKAAQAAHKVKFGDIDLAAAKKWDAILQGAEKNGIYLQMVLQHHGQYSTKVDPNWNANPYNVKNGGFLQSPEEFFSSPQARALTKRKLYYILARWGYSPNILAFELFNEVEGTDAGRSKLTDPIALWHREMALFLRQYDGYRHLLTTSSAPAIPLDSPIWETVDYVQTHTYPSDILTALGATETPDTYGTKPAKGKQAQKPNFIGEFGPSGLSDAQGVGLHQGLWASLMRNSTGAAEYWDWANVEQHDLYSHFKAASGFITASGLANHGSLVNTTLPVDTTQTAALRFGPGGGFVKATQNEFVVGKEGAPQGMDQFPTFLQGDAHRDMMPKPLTLHVQYPQAGTFTVNVEKIAKSGAHLKVTVDGKSVDRAFAAGDGDYTPKADARNLTVDVPQGSHAITIENAGKDWLVVRQFSLSNYTTALACSGRVGKDFAIAWVYHRGNIYAAPSKDDKANVESASGKVLVTGLQPGKYRYTWWDTYAGKAIDANDVSVDKAKDGLQISTPPVTYDVALYVTKASAPTPKSDKAPIKTARK